MNQGYFRSPIISQNTLYFLCDDDVWIGDIRDETIKAFRLTQSEDLKLELKISPDGKTLAFTQMKSGLSDVFIMNAEGGAPQRLTYFGDAKIAGFKNNNTIVISSNHQSFHRFCHFLYEINLDTFESIPVNLGPCSQMIFTDGHYKLLGRNLGDPARWKRYKGGTAGNFWVNQGANEFKQILKSIPNNKYNPIKIANRLYFITDYEGVSNIYSCTFKGSNLKRHTHQDEYYIRNFSHYEDRLVYQCGGDLFLHHLKSGNEEKISIDIKSPFSRSQQRFANIENNLQEFSVDNEGKNLALALRGQLFAIPTWYGAPRKLGKDLGTRYRLPIWLSKGPEQNELLAVELNSEQDETLVTFHTQTGKRKEHFNKNDWGKILNLIPNNGNDSIALTNNRSEVHLLNIKLGKTKRVMQSEFGLIQDVSWSPCGRYLAFQAHIDRERKGIHLYDITTSKLQLLINPVLADGLPKFDPKGEYLYFVGMREFVPVSNETHFDYGLPKASRVYCIPLKKELPAPWELYKDFENKADDDDSKKKAKKIKTVINFDGIENRIIALPISFGGILDIEALENRLLYFRYDHTQVGGSYSEQATNLRSFNLKTGQDKLFDQELDAWEISLNKKYLIYITSGIMRVINSDSKPTDGDIIGKKDGWIDLSRITLKINPKQEWEQMYQEAWVLQRENFWNEQMSKIDWENVYIKYLPLLSKVHTRYEFSDLIWEMQGELGTSHCYEMYGDYSFSRGPIPLGKLGARFSYDYQKDIYHIEKIYSGDSWVPGMDSPLNAPGVQLKRGDSIIGCEGYNFAHPQDLSEYLENHAGKNVLLQVQRKGKNKTESVIVQPVFSNLPIHYRYWVEQNKKYVHEKSNGRLGYLHIPDMGQFGLSEFYRYFIAESAYDGLIVDVRYNGGGNVSQLILKLLAQKPLGYDVSRWYGVRPYPDHTVPGPIVCLTNEHAGSDGDIFSHSFKLLKLGKLIGKRTWGGVIGIWPRHALNDGTTVTQPEFSFWFKDVGYNVENYGTDPDIDIEITPKDWRENKDPQLDRAIKEALKDLAKKPIERPALHAKPDLSAPKLPKR